MKLNTVIKIILFTSTISFAGPEDFWAPIPDYPATRVLNSFAAVDTNRRNLITQRAKNASEVGLLMIGNSITHYWERKAYAESYRKMSEGRNLLNMGLTAEVTPGMLHSLLERGWINLPEGVVPKVVIILAGTNNCFRTGFSGMQGKNTPPAEVADGIRAIAQVFARHFPTTKVIHMGMFPTSIHNLWSPINEVTADFTDNKQVYHINVNEQLLTPTGQFNQTMFKDGVHPNNDGYNVWVNGVKTLVDEFMAADPLDPAEIMLIGGSVTEGASAQGAYRRYLDGMLRREGHLIDFVGSRSKHNNNLDDPKSRYEESPIYYQYDHDHEGHWGRTSEWIADNIGSLAADNPPDIAVLQMGTEDLLAGIPTEKTVSGIGRTIDSLRDINSRIKIALANVIPTTSASVPDPDKSVQTLNRDIINLMINKFSKISPIIPVDQYAGMNPAEDLKDGVRPNAEGAQKMAGKFSTVIDAFLDCRGCRDQSFLEYDPTAEISDESLCRTKLSTSVHSKLSNIKPRPTNSGHVYDILGRRIGKLQGEGKGQNWDKAMNNGQGVKPGVYFVGNGRRIEKRMKN